MTTTKPATTQKKSCFESTGLRLVLGIDFNLSGGGCLMAPYAYLSRVEMGTPGELVFHYSFGRVCIRGENLDNGYGKAHWHELYLARCSEDAEGDAGGAHVREIVFTKLDRDEDA
jgi:hypothetical protein